MDSLWIARDGDGKTFLYTERPRWNQKLQCYEPTGGNVEKFTLPIFLLTGRCLEFGLTSVEKAGPDPADEIMAKFDEFQAALRKWVEGE